MSLFVIFSIIVSHETEACSVSSAQVTITQIFGADIIVGTTIIGGVGAGGTGVAAPLQIRANGCQEIRIVVDFTFIWDGGASSAWLHGVSFGNSSGWAAAQGTPPAGDWIYLGGITGICSGNSYGQGYYYDQCGAVDQSSFDIFTGGCLPMGNMPEPFDCEPSDNWGLDCGFCGNFGFDLSYCGTIEGSVTESFSFVLTDDGETGGWGQPANCVFTFEYPVTILEPEILLEPFYGPICAGDCIDLDSGLDCPSLNWSNGDRGGIITVCPTETTDYTVSGQGNCYNFEGNTTVDVIPLCCEAESGSVDAFNNYCPGDDVPIIATGFNVDPDYTQMIFIAGPDGTILFADYGSLAYFEVDTVCADYTLGSFNFYTGKDDEVVNPLEAATIFDLVCTPDCCEMTQYVIQVVDLESPQIEIPTDETISCLTELPSIENLQFTDNCYPTDSIHFSMDSIITSDCDTSFVVRTWIAEDYCGNTDTVMKMYTIPPMRAMPCDDDNLCTENDSIVMDCFGMICLPCIGDPLASIDFDVMYPQVFCPNDSFDIVVTGCDPDSLFWYSDNTLMNPFFMGDEFGYRNDGNNTSYWISCFFGSCEPSTVRIDLNPALVTDPILLLGQDYLCDENSEIIINVEGDFISYLWDDGSTADSLIVLNDGIYYCTVYDSNNCSATSSVEIFDESIGDISIFGNLSFCTSRSTNLSGPNGFNSYLWMPSGETSTSINVNTPGIISLQVTDSNGCTSSTVVTVEEVSELLVTIPQDTFFCEGDILSLSANDDMQDYLWSEGTTTQNIMINMTGMYTVTITDREGCSGSATVNVAMNPKPEILILGDDFYCTDQGGMLTASSDNLNYFWSSGEDTQSISPLEEGVYILSVTDVNGCGSSTAMFLNDGIIEDFEITGQDEFCTGLFTTISGPTGFDSYYWEPNGETTSSIDVNQDGNYTLTVGNIYGCTKSDEIEIFEVSSPEVNVFGDRGFCNGFTVILEAEEGFDEYSWSNGDMGRFTEISMEGTYTLSVSDLQGCSGSTMVTVSEYPNIDYNRVGGNFVCNGIFESIGISLAGQTYEWSTGEQSQMITATQSGQYVLNITDQNGCEYTELFDVTNVDLTIDLGPDMIRFCDLIQTSLGDQNYQASNGHVLEWTNQNGDILSSDIFLDVTAAGTYIFTVTDTESGCSASDQVMIILDQSLNVEIDGPAILCNQERVSLNSSVVAQTYLWSTGENTPSIEVESGGTYNLEVTSADGCTSTAQLVIIAEDIDAQVGANMTIDCNEPTIILGGLADPVNDWSYEWYGSDGMLLGNESQLMAIEADNYLLVAIGNNTGCRDSSFIEVVDLRSLPIATIFADPGNALNCQIQSITLMADENPNSIYNWTFENQSVEGTMVNIENSTEVVLTVIDTLTGCRNEETLFIQDFTDYPLIGFNDTDTLNCNNQSLTITLDDSNTTLNDNIVIQWYDQNNDPLANQTAESIIVLDEGWYYVELMDTVNNCVNLDSVQIIQDISEPIISAGLESTIDCDANMTTLTASTNDEYELNWTSVVGTILSGADATEATVSGEAWYYLSALARNGCSSIDSVFVNQLEAITDVIVEQSNTCMSANEGLIHVVDIVGGTAPFTFQLNGEQGLDGEFENLNTGVYNLEIEDVNGCLWSQEITIESFEEIQFSVDQDYWELFIPEEINVDLNFNMLEFDTIIWSPEPEVSCLNCLSPSLSITETSQYSVTIYDLNGCSKTIELQFDLVPSDLIYIPTAFSPNGDGVNDKFIIYPNLQISEIDELAIFDRWGNKLFYQEDFMAGEESNSWDGRHADRKVKAGVYVYLLKFTNIEGEEILISGDITIIR